MFAGQPIVQLVPTLDGIRRTKLIRHIHVDDMKPATQQCDVGFRSMTEVFPMPHPRPARRFVSGNDNQHIVLGDLKVIPIEPMPRRPFLP